MKEVKMPPLDGTQFVVVWVDADEGVQSQICKVVDNVINLFEGGNWIDWECASWDDDVNARYFVE